MNEKGIYVLILRLHNDIDLTVGKLQELKFKSGFYAYAGSALGTGGFKRVTRHFNIAEGKNHVRKWHIDHLLPHTELICAILIPTDKTLECAVAKELAISLKVIPGFGCTDCRCKSHLFFSGTDIHKNVLNICNCFSGNESIIIRPDI